MTGEPTTEDPKPELVNERPFKVTFKTALKAYPLQFGTMVALFAFCAIRAYVDLNTVVEPVVEPVIEAVVEPEPYSLATTYKYASAAIALVLPAFWKLN
jgi:hypothetical protein